MTFNPVTFLLRFIGFAIVIVGTSACYLIDGMGAIAQLSNPIQKQVVVQPILNVQTPGYAIRVFQRGDRHFTDIYEKSKRDLLLIQAPVAVKVMPEGTIYIHQRNDRTYTIRVQPSGRASLEIKVGRQTIIQEDELL